MKISKVVIPDLWDKYEITWKLKKHVNILSGINGSGKSTILRAIASALKGEPLPNNVVKRMSSIKIFFDSGQILELKVTFEKSKSKLTEDSDRGLTLKLKETNQKSPKLSSELINSQKLSLRDNKNNNLDIKDFLSNLKFSYISTFDCPPQRPDDPKAYLEYILNSSYSELDRHLEIIIDKFKTYQIELSSRITKMMSVTQTDSNRDDTSFIDIKALIKRRNILQDTIDNLMKESGKHLDREKGDLEFIFHSDNSSHSYKDLSAGEKQLLLILLTVFIQENKSSILIMDEPEISLHIDWQRNLIDIINSLNPNCQVIISTHSPSMILNGWHAAVDNISDLAKQI